MDHDLISFIDNVKKNGGKGRKDMSITPVNLESFQVKLKNKGQLDLRNIVSLYEWSRGILSASAQTLNFIFSYHKESPRYWIKNIDKPEDQEGKLIYSVGIDLEDFLESDYKKKQKDKIKALGSYIPDNYQLAKKVMKGFNNIYKKKHKIHDNSFRETALWESENLDEIKALGAYLEKKYIDPAMKAVFKHNKIEKIKFNAKKNKVDLVYSEN